MAFKIVKGPESCRFYKTWRENQAPLGSGMHWMETFNECNPPNWNDMSDEEYEKAVDDCHVHETACSYYVSKVIEKPLKCPCCRKELEGKLHTELWMFQDEYSESFACSKRCAERSEKRVARLLASWEK